MDVQPDDPERTSDPVTLDEARKRVQFYENYGVRTIINPVYSEPVGDPPTIAYLLFDGLGRTDPLRKDEARHAVRMILTRRFAYVSTPEYVRRVVDAFRDDPVRFLPMRYVKGDTPSRNVDSHRLDRPFLLISSKKHVIHHVKQRGYFERPTRVGALLESLSHTGMFTQIKPRAFPQSVITDVHDRHFVHFLKTICTKLATGKPVYPDTFPIRRLRRRPRMFPEQAGYYCFDSCTPLDGNAYAGARAAVNVAMTGAEEILAGRRIAYSLCRPPGHHAERRVYGGFCYFNNAAIAANYMARQAKTAVLDIDYHHGNGTQDIFYERSDVLTVSIHGHPDHAFPYFSGFADETGSGQGVGFNLNLPLPMETDEKVYLPALEKALRAIHKFKPDVLVVSLGLDILRGDPTGTFMIDPPWMVEIAVRLKALNLPLLIVQEGGYNLRGIKKGVERFFNGLR
jgi:acetoin utilization deacetylase AcuC-like enzyme